MPFAAGFMGIRSSTGSFEHCYGDDPDLLYLVVYGA
jgi:hypothetical protein